jgi:hypothetical protein
MLKKRPPYDVEVDAEVAKEYQRQQEEKRRARPDHSREIEAVRTQMAKRTSHKCRQIYREIHNG